MRFFPKFQHLPPCKPDPSWQLPQWAAFALLVVAKPLPLRAHDGDEHSAKSARTLTLSATGFDR